MIRRKSRIVVAITIALSALAVGPVLAQDSAAVAINTKDGSSIFRLAFNVHRTMSDVVDSSNAAVAYASCEDCRTVAVAIQVVLVMSDPSIVSPENVALAVNESCISCETLASAYQYVLGTDGVVHFDAEGNQELAAIRQALIDLAKSSDDLTIFEIQAQVDLLMEDLDAVLEDHLVAAGGAHDADTGVEPGEPSVAPSPATEPSPAETSEEHSTDPPSSPEPAGSPAESGDSSSPAPEPSASP
ncbi:MAG: hypothetical protein ABR613_09230 [Actinomycetota bacterium]